MRTRQLLPASKPTDLVAPEARTFRRSWWSAQASAKCGLGSTIFAVMVTSFSILLDEQLAELNFITIVTMVTIIAPLYWVIHSKQIETGMLMAPPPGKLFTAQGNRLNSSPQVPDNGGAVKRESSNE